MKYCNFFNKKCSFNKKGFTLLELIVVITIATVITTALVIQHNKWNDRLIVNTQSYELALMLRQAQFYSLAVKEDRASNKADKFSGGYGIYFNQNNNTQYIFFADRDGDKKYDSGEAIETVALKRGVTIKDICMQNSPGWCVNSGGGSFRQLNVFFFRPETKSYITTLNSGGNSVNAGAPPVRIHLRSPGGNEFAVQVDESGRISVYRI